MIVFLTDPTGLSDEATGFYKTMVIEEVMHAHYRIESRLGDHPAQLRHVRLRPQADGMA